MVERIARSKPTGSQSWLLFRLSVSRQKSGWGLSSVLQGCVVQNMHVLSPPTVAYLLWNDESISDSSGRFQCGHFLGVFQLFPAGSLQTARLPTPNIVADPGWPFSKSTSLTRDPPHACHLLESCRIVRRLLHILSVGAVSQHAPPAAPIPSGRKLIFALPDADMDAGMQASRTCEKAILPLEAEKTSASASYHALSSVEFSSVTP